MVNSFYPPVQSSHGDSITVSDGSRKSCLSACEKPAHVERTSSAAFITLTSSYCKMETR